MFSARSPRPLVLCFHRSDHRCPIALLFPTKGSTISFRALSLLTIGYTGHVLLRNIDTAFVSQSHDASLSISPFNRSQFASETAISSSRGVIRGILAHHIKSGLRKRLLKRIQNNRSCPLLPVYIISFF